MTAVLLPQESETPTGITAPVSTTDESEGKSAPSLGKKFFNVRTAISFALGFLILLFLLTRVQLDVGAIVDRIRQANPVYLVLAFVAFYATFPLRAVRWRQLLRNTGLHQRTHVQLPGILGLSEIILLSWFANCVVPAKLGDAYRAYLLKLNARVPFAASVGTILAERMIDVLVLFFLMVAAASLSFGQALPPQIVLLMQIGFALAVIVIVGLLVLRNLRPVVLRLLPHRFHAQYDLLEHGTLGSFRSLPTVILLTAASWAGEVLRLWFVTLALGVTSEAPSVLIFVALASALATTLPLTPAGLGFAEGTIIATFLLAAQAGLAPGVDDRTAASIALLDRGISYWSLIVVGLITYLISKRK